MNTDDNNDHRKDSSDWRLLLDALGVDGTWDWDIAAKTVRYDGGAAALLTGDPGLAGKDIDQTAALSCIHPEDASWLKHKTARLLRTSTLYLAEFRVVSRDGHQRWLLSRGRFERDGAQQAIRARGILIDVTEGRDAGHGRIVRPDGSPSDALNEIADLCLEAQQSMQTSGTPLLRMLMNTVLLELGYEIARRLKRRMGH